MYDIGDCLNRQKNFIFTSNKLFKQVNNSIGLIDNQLLMKTIKPLITLLEFKNKEKRRQRSKNNSPKLSFSTHYESAYI